MKETITFKNREGDVITIDITDQNIHEDMESIIRLLRYISYDDETIRKGLNDIHF